MLASVFMLILLLTWKQYRMPSPIIICEEKFSRDKTLYNNNASLCWMGCSLSVVIDTDFMIIEAFIWWFW